MRIATLVAPRVFRDVEISNVVAVLPGTLNKERQFVVAGHYESLHLTLAGQVPRQDHF